MSLYNGPPRAGARGGKDQFNWENVKSDQFRENYLGHSVKASVGRWQKGRDILWYTREKNEDESRLQDELAAVKEREEEMMLEALGMKPKRKKVVEMKSRLDASEMKTLLQRGGPEAAEGEAAAAPNPADPEGEGVRGLGYAPGAVTSMPTLEAGTDRMEGTVAQPVQQQGGAAPGAYTQASTPTSGGRPDKDALKRLRKLQKKAEKQARKDSKKSKKKRKEKKERKEKSTRRRDPSPGSSESPSDDEGRGRMASPAQRPSFSGRPPHSPDDRRREAPRREEHGGRDRDVAPPREEGHGGRQERSYHDEPPRRHRSRSPVREERHRDRNEYAPHSPDRHRRSRRY
mmetsp:Transcript_34944/g.89398  ORF Transcript_34944/g.89398 Transcript_34944/m.89398 type:complete len:345 (+) Transcript_34944:218-1252(+)|eukprot:jgi/Tetstr1/431799/TSEL_021294.t1